MDSETTLGILTNYKESIQRNIQLVRDKIQTVSRLGPDRVTSEFYESLWNQMEEAEDNLIVNKEGVDGLKRILEECKQLLNEFEREISELKNIINSMKMSLTLQRKAVGVINKYNIPPSNPQEAFVLQQQAFEKLPANTNKGGKTMRKHRKHSISRKRKTKIKQNKK